MFLVLNSAHDDYNLALVFPTVEKYGESISRLKITIENGGDYMFVGMAHLSPAV